MTNKTQRIVKDCKTLGTINRTNTKFLKDLCCVSTDVDCCKARWPPDVPQLNELVHIILTILNVYYINEFGAETDWSKIVNLTSGSPTNDELVNEISLIRENSKNFW